SSVALVTLPHGGFLLLPSPIFRSGEDSRHSIFNSLQDIAPGGKEELLNSPKSWFFWREGLNCDRI
ncbi:MAG: hypothetical protein ABSC63_08745, partial [Candidatus Binataceae bacterium]